jgi:uncharacterized phage protein (TIGR01671 family)
MKNREIRFRGWHSVANKMFSPEEMAADQLTLLPTGTFINVNGTHTSLSTIYDRNKFIALQSTGHTDSHNKEIFESDILRETIEWGDTDINNYYIVTWISEWCMFAALIDGEYENYLSKGAEALDEAMFWTFTIEKGNDFTVCGNIYEHPDYIRKCREAEGINEQP